MMRRMKARGTFSRKLECEWEESVRGEYFDVAVGVEGSVDDWGGRGWLVGHAYGENFVLKCPCRRSRCVF